MLRKSFHGSSVSIRLIGVLLALPASIAMGAAQGKIVVSPPVVPATSPPARSLAVRRPRRIVLHEINPRQNPFLRGQRLRFQETEPRRRDILIPPPGSNTGKTPSTTLAFEGIGSQGAVPPDTVGDVGPNHYVQMVNTQLAMYNKSGTLLAGPTDINQLWQGQGNICAARNDGDPVVLYDPIADRWFLSQFANPNHMCLAVSQTADPTGSYFLYQFDVTVFPDYFKLGVWPDALYMSANESGNPPYTAYAFDRTNMLVGNAATFQKFPMASSNFLLPSDLDGSRQPPANSPNYFFTFKDGAAHGGSDRIEIYAFRVDFGTPSNTTFLLAATIPISAFNYTVCGFFTTACIPQPGTMQRLDAVSEWPMWRLQYRNFGSYESLVGNFTVDVSGSNQAGIRWFELRKTGSGGWTLYQEGTHAPDLNHRWMGSIAMDRSGNIALGYSTSGTSVSPGIRYATRLVNDALGTLQAEATLVAGGSSQTFADRWGDYSSMNVDPSDDCTFWYTNEYYAFGAGAWQTRIGKFKIPTCGQTTIYFPIIRKSP